jgi:glycerol uptake facilitator-like aquaporin
MSLARRCAAEALGTAFLLAAVVGSGIMGDRLAGDNVAIALLANTLATVATLAVIITGLGPISGAHFNPAVTLVSAWRGGIAWASVPGYVASQVLGGLAGVLAAHAMFELPLWQVSQHVRSGPAQLFSESVATFGLLLTIGLVSKHRPNAVPFSVAAYVAGAYWFTASTSFANPAVTLARAFTDTFAGIRPEDVPGFVAAQMVGAALGSTAATWLNQETTHG